MDTKQLDDALARLFVDDGERIVFWHDPAQEFLDFMNRLPFLTFGNTTVHIIRLDQVSLLATKIRLERDEPDSSFLLYAPTEEPDYADDWLLDIRLYSRSFPGRIALPFSLMSWGWKITICVTISPNVVASLTTRNGCRSSKRW
jgi:hypothetical protein